MSEIDGKGISQLLLSPLFLLNHILGTVVPGALLILLLALKGNLLLRAGWLNPLFGYKTKVAIFLMLAFVIGSMLRLPLQFVVMAAKSFAPKAAQDAKLFLKEQPEAVRQAITGAMTDGVLLARPALMDRLSLLQTDVAFHLGIGTALLVAALVPGDSGLRWLEALLGLAMFVVGIRKGSQYTDQVWSAIGTGIAGILGSMTPEQIAMAKAVVKSLRLEAFEAQVPQATTAETPAPSSTLASKPESIASTEAQGPALIS